MDTDKYITVYMRTYLKNYRESHPDYVNHNNVKTKERLIEKYNNDIEYKERKKQQALARYYRLKEEKLQQAIPSV